MKDFKLMRGAPWGLAVKHMGAPKTVGLAHTVNTFRFNINRVHALATWPSNLVTQTMVTERAVVEEEYKRKSSIIILPPESHEAETERLSMAATAALRQYHIDYSKKLADGQPPLHIKNIVDTAYYNINFFSNHPVSELALQSWLFSQLTGVWTAAEILFVDLWESAINENPFKLANLADAKVANAIHIEKLKEFRFDISKNFGTLLRAKTRLDTLEKIQNKYCECFGDQIPETKDIISDPSFLVLSNVRHIIVHNAAKFDKQYLKNVGKISESPKGNPGDLLKIDGEIVHNLLNPVVIACVKLISTMDEWISENKEEKSS